LFLIFTPKSKFIFKRIQIIDSELNVIFDAHSSVAKPRPQTASLEPELLQSLLLYFTRIITETPFKYDLICAFHYLAIE
jgi:hypothetical protein